MGTEVHVLGRPRLLIDGVIQPLSGRPMLLVARLALGRDGAVPSTRLRDDLWHDDDATDGAVRVALTRARKALGDVRLERTGGGYALVPMPDTDVTRFEAAVRNGRDRGLPIERRCAEYERGLSEWHGAAFDGVDAGPWFEAERHRLDELMQQATDERFELLLAAGAHERIVGEVAASLALTPTRERRAELLMTALYRCGRQEDALAVFQQLREHLREHLGLEPGPSVRALEQQILEQAPELDARSVALTDHAAEVESRLRAATALMRSGVVSETRHILDEADAIAQRSSHRALLGHVRLAQASLAMIAGDGGAHEMIDEARQIGRSLRDGPLLAGAALGRFAAGIPLDKHGGLVEFLEPLPLLPPDSPRAMELLCCAALLVTFTDGGESAEHLLREVTALCERDPSPRARALMLVTTAVIADTRGRPADEVDAAADEAYRIAVSTGEQALIVAAAHGAIRSAYGRGDLAAVESLLPTLESVSRAALLPFGIVRVALCRNTNALARGHLDELPHLFALATDAGARMGTFAAHAGVRNQQLLMLLEDDRADEIARQAAEFVDLGAPPGSWHAAKALDDDVAAAALLEQAPRVPRNDLHGVFVALAALVAFRRGDDQLAAWCVPELDAYGDRTVVSGVGTLVLGPAAYFAGLARVVMGDLDAAASSLDRAAAVAAAGGAELWWAHAALESAAVQQALGRHVEARALLRAVSESHCVTTSTRLRRRLAAVVGSQSA